MTTEQNQSNETKKASQSTQPKQPNKLLAPIIIAGITVGFLASAYKFVFAKSDPHKKSTQSKSNSTSSAQDDD
ncbi:hypothetical protein G9F32_05970 [Acinetobacter sp. 194]|nr:hypothetical protein [Acinetobacter shaoyimingii]